MTTLYSCGFRLLKMEKVVFIALSRVIYGFSCSSLYVERLHQDVVRNISISSCTFFKGVYNNETKDCICPSSRPTFVSGKDGILSCRKLDTLGCQFSYKDNVTSREILRRHKTANWSGSWFGWIRQKYSLETPRN